MLAELRMALSVDKEGFGYYQSSNMQGVLMEHLENSYAEKLHQQGLKPYSPQYAGCRVLAPASAGAKTLQPAY